MEIEFLGGAQEVGKAGIAAYSNSSGICLDFGMAAGEEPDFPVLPSRKIDSLVLSHAHLDHVGGAPILFKDAGNPSLICNDITFDTTKMLVEDALKIARMEMRSMPYGKDEYKKMKDRFLNTAFYQPRRVGDLSVELIPAGHIPGAAGIIVEHAGKRAFYTGDFKFEDMRLVKGADVPKNIDTLVIESTYAQRDHPNRQQEEKKLIDAVEEAISNNGKVLIPVFAVGRAQEILLILEEYASKIAFDGMARTMSKITMKPGYEHYTRNHDKMKEILGRVMWVSSEKERSAAAKNSPIVVTTAGMAVGGPIHYYIKSFGDANCKVVFVGYLPKGTVGRRLMDTGILHSEGSEFKVKCHVEQLDFSAHAGRTELFNFIEAVNPKEVYCVYGDDTPKFAREITEKFGIDAHAPKVGDVVRV